MTRKKPKVDDARETARAENERRAENGRALLAWIAVRYPDDDAEAGIVDALTDLRHALEKTPLSFEQIAEMAGQHFDAEQAEEMPQDELRATVSALVSEYVKADAHELEAARQAGEAGL